jgi:hypothetical protein
MKDGFIAKNKWDAYTINGVTGIKNADDSTTVFLSAIMTMETMMDSTGMYLTPNTVTPQSWFSSWSSDTC